MNLLFRGRCWKFADYLHCDGDMMPLHFAKLREIRPEVLRDHIMTGLDPEFPKKVQPGDIIVAGKGFGSGHPHSQCMIGFAGAKVGVVAESIPRGSFRNIINAAVPALTHCPEVTQHCNTGDELEVDFRSGRFVNLTTGKELHYTPLDPRLLETIEMGGWKAVVKRRIENMRANTQQAERSAP